MKRHHWLILIIVSLLGMLFVPKMAYSAQFVETIPDIMASRTIIPVVTLPGRQLPFPSTIPGPAIQLPIPVIPVVSVPERISVTGFAAPRAENRGVFAGAQKMFASAPGSKGPSERQLSAGFDTGAVPSGAAHADAVEVNDAPRPQPRRKQQRVNDSRVIQVPTWQLENEIGI